MNLYKLHSNPESLDLYEKVSETNPDVFWEKYKKNKEELKKRETYIAKDAFFAYLYAKNVLKGPFPAGEEAIAKDYAYAYYYARDVLKGPFPLGEAAIAKSAFFTIQFTQNILKKDFYLNDELIAKYKP